MAVFISFPSNMIGYTGLHGIPVKMYLVYEMELVIRVQILDKVCISLRANILREGMNLFLLFLAMGKLD